MPRKAETRTIFEYKVIHETVIFDPHGEYRRIHTNRLNQLGEQGWELVSTEIIDDCTLIAPAEFEDELEEGETSDCVASPPDTSLECESKKCLFF